MKGEKDVTSQSFVRNAVINLSRDESEGKTRYDLSFSSEEPYRRWFGTEILKHDEGCVDLTRLQEIGVVLFNHNRDKVIGKIVNPRVENKRGLAEIIFDEDEFSKMIKAKVDNGTLKGVSVGYSIKDYEIVRDNKGRVKGYDVTKWQPFEISIVSVPADVTVGVGRSDEEQEQTSFVLLERQIEINKNKEREIENGIKRTN